MAIDLSSIVGKNVETTVNSDGGKQSKLKARFDLIPPAELFEVAIVLAEGAETYGEYNWQKIKTNDHLSHALAHIFAHLAGDTSDEHLSHALCRLFFASFTSKREAGSPESTTEKRDSADTTPTVDSIDKEYQQLSAAWAELGRVGRKNTEFRVRQLDTLPDEEVEQYSEEFPFFTSDFCHDYLNDA